MASLARCSRIWGASRLSSPLMSLPSASVQFHHALKAPQPNRFFHASPISPIRKFTKDHEWVDLAADHKTGVIGISDFAAKSLGDVVYVELPELGKMVKRGDPIGAVESVKSAADINAPISCTVWRTNLALEEKPVTISQVPEDDSTGGGWLAKIKIDDPALAMKELELLMDPDEYKNFVTETSED